MVPSCAVSGAASACIMSSRRPGSLAIFAEGLEVLVPERRRARDLRLGVLLGDVERGDHRAREAGHFLLLRREQLAREGERRVGRAVAQDDAHRVDEVEHRRVGRDARVLDRSCRPRSSSTSARAGRPRRTCRRACPSASRASRSGPGSRAASCPPSSARRTCGSCRCSRRGGCAPASARPAGSRVACGEPG